MKPPVTTSHVPGTEVRDTTRARAQRPLSIGIISSVRHGIREPFAGGLEMHTYALATSLRHRGHDVTVFASMSSDPELGVEPICKRGSNLDLSQAAQRDASMVSKEFMLEHHAYLDLMLRLSRRTFDVIHNNSLHYLPIAMAPSVPQAVLTTLHTPPTPWMESAITMTRRPGASSFVSVSRSNARQWHAAVEGCRVIPNGIDLERWRFSPEGDPERAVWTGRLVREKGPHLAVEAAHRAGLQIDLAGPIHDPAYFDEAIEPMLRPGDRYVGHLPHDDLAGLVGRAGVFLCTPCWDEPYGLVVAEALACGTPVAAFERGAVPEILSPASGRMAPPGDTDALANAAREALRLNRHDCRRRAETHCSLHVMIDRYETLYQTLSA